MLPLARKPPTVLRRVSSNPVLLSRLFSRVGVFCLDDREHELHGASHWGIGCVACGFSKPSAHGALDRAQDLRYSNLNADSCQTRAPGKGTWVIRPNGSRGDIIPSIRTTGDSG